MMGFVNEKYPETEKQRIAELVEKRPPLSNPQSPTKWTVDHDRNAFLVVVGSEGGGYEGTQTTLHFILQWRGDDIHLSASPLGVSNVEGGVVMSWKIDKLRIPPALIRQESEIVALLRDAFRVLGDVYDGDEYVAVNLDFNSSIAG